MIASGRSRWRIVRYSAAGNVSRKPQKSTGLPSAMIEPRAGSTPVFVGNVQYRMGWTSKGHVQGRELVDGTRWLPTLFLNICHWSWTNPTMSSGCWMKNCVYDKE